MIDDKTLMKHVRLCKDSVVIRQQTIICKQHDMVLELP